MAEKRVALLGRIAVQLKMISMDQLAEAVREAGRPGESRRLGEILVAKGFITSEQLAKVVQVHHNVIARHKAKQAADAAISSADPRPMPPAAPTSAPAAPPRSAAEAGPPEPAPAVEAAPARSGSAALQPAFGPPLAAPSIEDARWLDDLLRAAVERGASDVHFHVASPIKHRVNGVLDAPGSEVLDPDALERTLVAALQPEERERLATRGEVDFCYELEGVGRFRANVYRQQRGVDGVFRAIPGEPPSFSDLGLPDELARYANFHQGMVLVTGPAGCGKSSTLAAMIDLINEERREHILTVEDPIEYLHPSKRCLVNQRHAGRHTGSFARALRAALREDPDVIVIGELRDLETVSLALTAAETGHFVLATMHTRDSIRTINRLIGSFPADQQDQVRRMISESLRAVISQRLIPAAHGSRRAPALEVLVVTKAVGNLIRENKTIQILSILQTGSAQGMHLMDHSIRKLLQSGTITREEALRHCDDPKKLGAGAAGG